MHTASLRIHCTLCKPFAAPSVVSPFVRQITWFEQNSDGTFTTRIIYNTAAGASGIKAAGKGVRCEAGWLVSEVPVRLVLRTTR